MSGSPSQGVSLDVGNLISTLAAQQDPLGYLALYLEEQRIPPQGRLFKIHALAALAIHACIILCILLTTWVRSKRGQLWFTRRQQGKLRLNATVIAILFAAIYSSMAMAYTVLLLYQQRTGKYLAGSAAFQMSCFSAISFCVSIIAFTYHQSLPVGFEGSFFRVLFRKSSAAADRRFFSFALLCLWLVVSLAGTMVLPLMHDHWRRQVDSTLQGVITYLERSDVRERGLPAIAGVIDQLSQLPVQVQLAQLALRRQLLVYIGHCALYLLILVPVAYKLLTLLSHQMDALRRSAEDYFRLGTRIKQREQPVSKSIPAFNRPLLASAPPSSSDSGYNSKRGVGHQEQPIAVPKAVVIVCNNCSHKMPVETGPCKTGIPHSARFAQRPEMHAPRYIMHPDFPLHKVERLRRVRLELGGFSAVILLGLANFLAWSCICYIYAPSWSSSDMTANLFIISLWSYAVPAGISSVFYAYTTALLRPSPLASMSTTTSQRSGPTQSSHNECLVGSYWRRFIKGRPKDQSLFDSGRMPPEKIRIMYNKRSRPTFPRTTSFATLGGRLMSGCDMEVIANPNNEGGHQYSQLSLETLQWVEEQKQAAAKDSTPRVPSRVSLRGVTDVSRRILPRSMTQSWLEIEDE